MPLCLRAIMLCVSVVVVHGLWQLDQLEAPEGGAVASTADADAAAQLRHDVEAAVVRQDFDLAADLKEKLDAYTIPAVDERVHQSVRLDNAAHSGDTHITSKLAASADEWIRFDNSAHSGDILGPVSGRVQTLLECKVSCLSTVLCAGFTYGDGGKCWKHTKAASANREQLGSSVYTKKTYQAAGNWCLQNTSNRRTWKLFSSGRSLVPCIDATVGSVQTSMQTQERPPLWAAWTPLGTSLNGDCDLKTGLFLQNFQINLDQVDQQQLTLSFTIMHNASSCRINCDIEQDQFLVLASSSRLRLLGKTTPVTKQQVNVSVAFPSNGTFFIEVYWMQSGPTGMTEPQTNLTLAQLQVYDEAREKDEHQHVTRCAPQLPVDAFFFEVPMLTSKIGALDVNQLDRCWDHKRERHSPSTAAVANWEGSNFPSQWKARFKDASEVAKSGCVWNCKNGRECKNELQVMEEYECGSDSECSDSFERQSCAYSHRAAGPYIKPELWLSGVQGKTSLCAYKPFDVLTARAWLHDHGVEKITIVGDSHADYLANAMRVFLQLPTACIGRQMLFYGTRGARGDRDNREYDSQYADNMNVQGADVSDWATCSGFMINAGMGMGMEAQQRGNGTATASQGVRSIAVFAFGTWVAAYRTLEVWTQVVAAMRKGLLDCRDNHPSTWQSSIIIWAEAKYRFSPNRFHATPARLEQMNEIAFQQLGGVVHGWVDTFGMSKAAPEFSRDCNHWRPSADEYFANAVLNEAAAAVNASRL
jgi:hypothetical protein